MNKYYCSFEGIMKIKELNEIGQNSRSNYEKLTNTFCSVKLFDTLELAIKSLDSYSKITILPNGDEIIPYAKNYPQYYFNVLKKVRFPILESL